MKLEAFLNNDSLAAMKRAEENPAPPPPPPRVERVLVQLVLPKAPPVLGAPCPSCGKALELRGVPWPPRAKPKGGPWEGWWCSACDQYFVYEEKRDGGDKGGAKAPLPKVQRPHGGNGRVQPVREGGVPGAVQHGGQKRPV